MDLNGTEGTVGWFRSDVNVTLVATDVTGVRNTCYQIDQGPCPLRQYLRSQRYMVQSLSCLGLTTPLDPKI